MAPKPTTVDLATLKQALVDLQALESAMGNGTGGAYGKLADATDVTTEFGPLVDSAGTQISAYINVRATAVRNAIHTSGQGVSAAISMLKSTIDSYDTHEHQSATAANNTGSSGNAGANPGKG